MVKHIEWLVLNTPKTKRALEYANMLQSRKPVQRDLADSTVELSFVYESLS